MKKILLCVGMMVLLCCVSAQAQDKATINYGDSDLTISGYGHFWFATIETDKSFTDIPDGFDTRRMRLILTGHLASDVSYKVQLDLEDEQLRDYWVKFNKFMGSEDLALNATVGQGKIHFSEAERVWISPAATFIRGIRIYDGGVATIADRDMGIIVDGKAVNGKLTFYVGFLNGNGIGDAAGSDTSPGDNADQKDMLVRLLLAPFEDEQLKNLTFGLGFMSGSQADTAGTGVDKRDRLCFTAQYEKDDLKGLLEYISQTREASSAAPATDDDAETTNLSLEGAYTLRPEFLKEGQTLQLVLRFQQYEHDNGNALSSLDAGDEDSTITTLGANLNFSSNVRFMLNYNMIADDTYVPADLKDSDVDNDELLLQLEMKF